MENDKIPPELEKYSPWPKVFRRLEGHVLIISTIYLIAYILISIYLGSIDFQISNIQQTLYFIGFGLFILLIFLTFVGFMFRSIK